MKPSLKTAVFCGDAALLLTTGCTATEAGPAETEIASPVTTVAPVPEELNVDATEYPVVEQDA